MKILSDKLNSYIDTRFAELFQKFGPLPAFVWDPDLVNFFMSHKDAPYVQRLRLDDWDKFWLWRGYFSVVERLLSKRPLTPN
jgi:hypothetical protein